MKKTYQYGEVEEKIDEVVSEHLIMPMFSKETKRKNRIFGIKCLLITIICLLLGIGLIIWSINSQFYRIIKIVGATLFLIVALVMGVVTYAVLVPPKFVNAIGRFDKK